MSHAQAKRLFSNDAKRPSPLKERGDVQPPVSLEATESLSLHDLLVRVPTRALARQAAEGYFFIMAWWSNVVSREQYHQEEEAVFAAVSALPTSDFKPSLPASLALCFAVWSVGLAMIQYSTASSDVTREDGLGSRLDGYSRTALVPARAVEQPSLDTLRTMLLLAPHYTLVSSGEAGRLDLHRDPDDLPDAFTDAEAEDRRNLFHATLVQDNQVASFSSEPTKQRHGTHYLRSLSLMSEQVTQACFGQTPVSYQHILDLDHQLSDLWIDMPDAHKPERLTSTSNFRDLVQVALIQFVLAHERFRLHRPFLSRAYADPNFALSRQTCLSAARQLLEILESPAIGAVWGCATYVRVSAATVLCVDLIFQPAQETAVSDKALVRKKIDELKPLSKMSTVARRGRRLLQFLLDKIDSRSNGGTLLLPERKRPRTAVPQPQPTTTADGPVAQYQPLARPSTSFSDHTSPSTSITTASNRSRRSRPGSPPPLSPHDRASPPTSLAAPPLADVFRSAADDLAALDFAALLGVERQSGIFTFGSGEGEGRKAG
ncbi:hypothetical protein JCM10207_002171 [Rhodosporidiobolus poonsookiae]